MSANRKSRHAEMASAEPIWPPGRAAALVPVGSGASGPSLVRQSSSTDGPWELPGLCATFALHWAYSDIKFQFCFLVKNLLAQMRRPRYYSMRCGDSIQPVSRSPSNPHKELGKMYLPCDGHVGNLTDGLWFHFLLRLCIGCLYYLWTKIFLPQPLK